MNDATQSQLHVVPVGAFVKLVTGGEPQKAQVTAVTIRENNKVTYEVVWWAGMTRNCAWVEACEVMPFADCRPKQIGFLQPKEDK